MGKKILLVVSLCLLVFHLVYAFNVSTDSYSVDSYHTGDAGGVANSSFNSFRFTTTFQQGSNPNVFSPSYTANSGWFSEAETGFIVDLIFPPIIYFSISHNQTFNCSAYGDDLYNLTLFIWNENDINYTTTINISEKFGYYSFDVSDMPYGTYEWNCLAYKSSGESQWAENNHSLVISDTLLGWSDIVPPEGVFEPSTGGLTGTHIDNFIIKFEYLSIQPDDELKCEIKVADGSILVVNETGLNLDHENYSMSYTVTGADSIINDPSVGYIPWILKNCTMENPSDTIIKFQEVNSRIYVHDYLYWGDDEITRAVACEGTSGVYFNNTAKCEFSEDTLFALQMRNGNDVVADCFNSPGDNCSFDYCNGIYFPTCDPLEYLAGYSALTDDPNGYTIFSVSFADYTTPIAYSRFSNSSGTFKLRVLQYLDNKPFSITIFNLTNVSGANVYGNSSVLGNVDLTQEGDGTWNVALNRLGSNFTGELDFVFNISFDDVVDEDRDLKLVIAYGTDTNQGSPTFFPVNFSSDYGLYNNNESQNTSATVGFIEGPVCGDEANNDFDYLGGTWVNSFDCFDPDCDGFDGDNSQTNEFGGGNTGLCNYATEDNCSDFFDNDYDYIAGTDYTDCHDSDCFQIDVNCPSVELICDDGINNDWDYTLGESNLSSDEKIENNGVKYGSGYFSDLTDCEDVDCDGSVGGGSGQLCTWGHELNCSDGFDNDALQLKDCDVSAVASSTAMPSPANAEYDCSLYCRSNVDLSEEGSQCDDNIDNDWDAVTVTGYYSDEFFINDGLGDGIDCRWGGYYGYGSSYNPDEDCNGTLLSSGAECQLGKELNCSDGFDNDYDNDAVGMPHANWNLNTTAYFDYFGVMYSDDADYDDYDCKGTAPFNESFEALWCFDGIDNDLDAYVWSGGDWELNPITGIDCDDPDCLGVQHPSDPNQRCLGEEYNVNDSFFTDLPFPGFYCNNTFDDDSDGDTDCDDSDCFKQFDLCSQGPCYNEENLTWDSCADGVDNDHAEGIDCADSDCYGMVGSLSGALCSATEVCSDGFDNDASGGVDCADHSDCDGLVGRSVNGSDVYCRAVENSALDCYDGFDNDADGYVDCYDVSCNAECSLSTISGLTPVALPEYISGPPLSGNPPGASISSYTRRIREGEFYNITFRMTGISTNVVWTLGTALGGGFDKSSFDVSSAYLGGSNAGDFSIVETANGFIVQSDGADLSFGYEVSFLINSTGVLSASTYEVTYGEEEGSVTSLYNYVYHEVDESVVPVAQSIEVVPDGVEYGGVVYLRANISDNNQLGMCDWDIGGVDIFNPSDSIYCRAVFSPVVEGVYEINVTPIDYYYNIGDTITKSYDLNIVPKGKDIIVDKRFYFSLDSLVVNASFDLVNDSLGDCEVFARNEGGEFSLGVFSSSGNYCYNDSVNISGLGDGSYELFVRVNEISEGDVVDGLSEVIFVCSQTDSGVCRFADFNFDGYADVCGALGDIFINAIGCTSPINIGDPTTCSASVSDDSEIDSVFANVTRSGSVLEQLISCSGIDTSKNCEFTFTDTTVEGTYSVSWFANDTIGNVDTGSDSFSVQGAPSPPPGDGGRTGGRGGAIAEVVVCFYEWVCTDWEPTVCEDEIQTRTCVNKGTCTGDEEKPEESRECVPPYLEKPSKENISLRIEDKILFKSEELTTFLIFEDILLENATLDYIIIDKSGKRVYNFKEVTNIPGDFIFEIDFVKLRLESGNYKLIVTVKNGIEKVLVQDFKIISFEMYFIIVCLLILGILFLLFFIKRRKRKDK